MRFIFTLFLFFSSLASARAIPDSAFQIQDSKFITAHFSSSIPHSSFLIPHTSFPVPHSPFLVPIQKKFFDTTVAERGWVIRAAYNRQEAWNYGEIGFGRSTRLQHYNDFGKGTTSAVASFVFGIDASYDTSFVYAPKLSIEGSCIIFGGRVSYGYYMQDHRSSGVIGIEGGFNFVNTLFIYGGYNFVKAKSGNSVITEGPKFSVGFNFPFGMRRVQPPKSSTHL